MRIKEKTIPENLVAVTNYSSEGLNNSLYNVFEWAKEDKVVVNGVPFARLENISDDNASKICGLSVSGENLNPKDGIEIKTFKKHDVACLMHIGSHKTVINTYNKLVDYCNENNYKSSGVSYLIFVNNPFYTDENQLITEVQLVIEK